MGDSPTGDLKDAQDRPIFPKGAICSINVEELSLPPAGSGLIHITDVCLEASAYLEQFEKRMLRPPGLVGQEAIPPAERVCTATRSWSRRSSC